MRRLAFLVLGLVACSPAVDSNDTQRATSCGAYLDCLAETDPSTFEDEIGVYGNNGSCFADADDDDCQTACLNKLDDLGEDDVEACQPPPEPSPDPSENPEPDEDGYVDCAAIVGGPTVGPGEPGPLGFPEAACNPRATGMGEFRCCSDDPASVGGGFPAFQGQNISGGMTPYFAGANNGLGTSGLCVRTGDLPAGSGLQEAAAAGCPIPCNPTWDDAGVATVCGANRTCCQTRVIRAEDCVQEDGLWRPATGEDILAGLSNWAPAQHATHQDANGQGCATIAGGGDTSNPEFLGCIEELTVANQRGYCMALAAGQGCPGDQSGFVDACEQINMGLLPPPR